MRPRHHLPPQASLDGFYTFFDVEDCLMFIARELGKIGAGDEDLLEYQRRLLDDLTSAIDEQSLAKLYDYWDYDLDGLYARGRQWREGMPAKPRVDLFVEITSKENLKVEWFPQGSHWQSPPPNGPQSSDFRHWYRIENRNGGFDSRPSNELMFLHGAGYARRTIDRPSASQYPLRILDHVLLAACHSAVKRLKNRLERHFAVRMLTDVFTEWDDPDPGPDWHHAPARLLSWKIEDPEERKTRAERAELDGLESALGFSAEALLAALIESQAKKKTGPPASAHSRPARIAKILKAGGLAATSTKVERALYLMEKYRTLELARAQRTASE